MYTYIHCLEGFSSKLHQTYDEEVIINLHKLPANIQEGINSFYKTSISRTQKLVKFKTFVLRKTLLKE